MIKPILSCPSCQEPATIEHFQQAADCAAHVLSLAGIVRVSRRKTVGKSPGRPFAPRCKCGSMTAERAGKIGHACSDTRYVVADDAAGIRVVFKNGIVAREIYNPIQDCFEITETGEVGSLTFISQTLITHGMAEPFRSEAIARLQGRIA